MRGQGGIEPATLGTGGANALTPTSGARDQKSWSDTIRGQIGRSSL